MMNNRTLPPDAENTLDWFQNVVRYGNETGDIFFIWVSQTHLELVVPNPIDIMYWKIEQLVEGPDNNMLLDPKTPDITVHNLFNSFMDQWVSIINGIRNNSIRIMPEIIHDGILSFVAEKKLDRILITIRRFESIGELEKTLGIEVLGDSASTKDQRGRSHA